MNQADRKRAGRALWKLALVGLFFPILCETASAETGIRLELVAADGGRTTALVHAGDGTDRLFIVKQTGQIFVLDRGTVLDTPFLDISDRVACCANERGLVSLAFHPDYETNGRFFIGYVATDLRTVVSRFRVSADPNRAVVNSERELLSWEKRDINHHGGILAFGPDGYLYIANGEGGARGEAENLESFPGTILRIDVDRGSTYRVPKDNPFRGMTGVLPEIWAYGVRNPWRLTFDRETGDLFFGDVGAANFEEISFAPAGSPGGLNFGWPVKEGTNCLRSEEECADESLVDPIVEYSHDKTTPECNSVTGGYFYRGPRAPTLYGTYLYGDFCTGEVWGARRNSADRWVSNQLLDTGLLITSFGESESGELYLAHFLGEVYRVAGQELFATDFEAGDLRDWSARRRGPTVASPGLRGSEHALEIGLGDGSVRRFVRSDEPSGESTFRLGFDLSVNNADLGGEAIEFLRLAGTRRKGHIRLTVEEDGGRYWLNLLVRRADDKLHQIGRTRLPSRRKVKIELDWLRASGADAADGEIMVFKNGRLKIGATDLANNSRRMRSVTVGLPSGSAPAASGSLLIDNYTSTP